MANLTYDPTDKVWKDANTGRPAARPTEVTLDVLVGKYRMPNGMFTGKPHSTEHRPEPAAQAAAENEAGRLAADFEALKTTFESFKNSAPSKEELAEFERKFADLASKVAGLEEALGKIGNVDDLVRKVQGLVAELQRLGNEDAAWRNQVEEGVNDLKKKVDNLTGAVAAHDRRLDDLSGRLAGAAGPAPGPTRPEPQQATGGNANQPASPRDAGSATKEPSMSWKTIGQLAGVAAVVILALFVGYMWPQREQNAKQDAPRPPAAVGQDQQKGQPFDQSRVTTRGDVDEMIDRRITPINERLTKVEQTGKALEKGLADVNEKVETSKSEVLAKVDEVLKNLKTKAPEATPPAASAPTAPPVSDKLAQQNAQIRAACPPYEAANIDLKSLHSAEVMDSIIKHCEALKAGRAASPSTTPDSQVAAAPGSQEDAEEEEEERVAGSPPAAQPAGYRPGWGGPGYGPRRGGRPNCRHWPGFAYNPANGRCELTRGRDASVAKYDRPRAGCRPEDVQTLSVPLPNGGTRTIRMVCRADGR